MDQGASHMDGATRSAISPGTRKGERTKRRIVDATMELLGERSFGQLKITEITRRAEVVQPTFYTYFSSIEEVVLEAAREASTDCLAHHFESDWIGPEGLARARAFVKDSIRVWDSHKLIHNLTMLLADQGIVEFQRERIRQSRPMVKGLEYQVKRSQAAGLLPEQLNARLVAYEALSILIGLGSRPQLFRDSGFTDEQLVDTTARLLLLCVTGSPGD